jgi:hypothetical protein
VTEVIGESVGDGHRVAAEFDRSGGLHVITTNYGSGDGGPVRYAHRDPVTGVWSYVELEGEGSVECTLALGSDGVPHVAFVRLDNSDAKVVYDREDKKAGEWNLTTLPESAHNREVSPALTVDAAGVAHLIYSREDNNLQGGSLEYVRIDGLGAELVGVPPESGSFPAIAHAGGTLRLVYQRFPNSDLVYRTCGEDGE